MDAAASSGANTVVWAGQMDFTKIGEGKNPIESFDIKADITTYGRKLGAFNLIDVQPGAYASNYITRSAPRKQEDGTYVLALPLREESPMPIIDMESDYGKYVVGALESGLSKTVHAGSYYISGNEIAKEFERGKLPLETPFV